jgi:hypothetical protein
LLSGARALDETHQNRVRAKNVRVTPVFRMNNVNGLLFVGHTPGLEAAADDVLNVPLYLVPMIDRLLGLSRRPVTP